MVVTEIVPEIFIIWHFPEKKLLIPGLSKMGIFQHKISPIARMLGSLVRFRQIHTLALTTPGLREHTHTHIHPFSNDHFQEAWSLVAPNCTEFEMSFFFLFEIELYFMFKCTDTHILGVYHTLCKSLVWPLTHPHK